MKNDPDGQKNVYLNREFHYVDDEVQILQRIGQPAGI
jgi:hypothetical protein